MAATAQRRAKSRARADLVDPASQTRVAVIAQASIVRGNSGATHGCQPVASASECRPEKLEMAADVAETVMPSATQGSRVALRLVVSLIRCFVGRGAVIGRDVLGLGPALVVCLTLPPFVVQLAF